MGRKSIPAQVVAERKFPVRVRIFVPPCGLRDRLIAFDAWLRARYGNAGYYIGTYHGPGLRDGVLVYLPDVPGADELVKRFDLSGLIDKAEPPSVTPAPPRRTAPPIDRAAEG
jgi:hypothetical protein